MTQSPNQEIPDNDLAALHAELAEREAAIVQRERALQAREAALPTIATPVTAPTGLMEADLDASTMPPEAEDGHQVLASPQQRKAYAQWLREAYPGCTPLKNFQVTLKQRGNQPRVFTLAAVDEPDARRQAYQQAGITQRSEGFHAEVQRTNAV